MSFRYLVSFVVISKLLFLDVCIASCNEAREKAGAQPPCPSFRLPPAAVSPPPPESYGISPASTARSVSVSSRPQQNSDTSPGLWPYADQSPPAAGPVSLAAGPVSPALSGLFAACSQSRDPTVQEAFGALQEEQEKMARIQALQQTGEFLQLSIDESRHAALYCDIRIVEVEQDFYAKNCPGGLAPNKEGCHILNAATVLNGCRNYLSRSKHSHIDEVIRLTAELRIVIDQLYELGSELNILYFATNPERYLPQEVA